MWFYLDVNLEKIARGTGGFSGADLANLVNQAAIRGSSLGRGGVTNDDLDYARDKIIMGNVVTLSCFCEEVASICDCFFVILFLLNFFSLT